MVVFNECRIDSEGKNLIIEASVDNLDYYRDIVIDSVVIDIDDTYSESGPSDNPVYSKTFEDVIEQVFTAKGCAPVKVQDTELQPVCVNTSRKNIKLVLSAADLALDTLQKNLFFVYVIASGTPAASTPCTMDNQYVIGVAFYWKPIYNMIMQYFKEFSQRCEIPKGFIDAFLRLKAFELALKTGHYLLAIKYFKQFFLNRMNIKPISTCGCDGS